ncbi:MAG: biotin synthase BioB [Deltaproteobacteria bacterium]|nr:biotin synthase BioB [Deltaproteobacteria bacterium]
MDRKYFIELAQQIVDGNTPSNDVFAAMAQFPDRDAFQMLAGADLIREHFFGKTIHLCTICNGKSGRCSEDCRFCAQSAHFETDAPQYPLMDHDTLVECGALASGTPINRYSIVTTGRGLPDGEVAHIAAALKKGAESGIHTCASLGILEEGALSVLKDAGVDRYHHNLETCESHFPATCSTHDYQDRVETIRHAKKLDMSVCAGGIFGIGESREQVLELALALRELGVDAVPLNFLVPIKGTPLAQGAKLTPMQCLKIIALYRFVLPDKEIIICGGREANLKELHPLVFYAGASGIMTGNYLTAAGRSLENDLEMIARLEFTIRKR